MIFRQLLDTNPAVAASDCIGCGWSDIPFSTLGPERRANPAFAP